MVKVCLYRLYCFSDCFGALMSWPTSSLTVDTAGRLWPLHASTHASMSPCSFSVRTETSYRLCPCLPLQALDPVRVSGVGGGLLFCGAEHQQCSIRGGFGVCGRKWSLLPDERSLRSMAARRTSPDLLLVFAFPASVAGSCSVASSCGGVWKEVSESGVCGRERSLLPGGRSVRWKAHFLLTTRGGLMLSWTRAANDLGLSFSWHQGNKGNGTFRSFPSSTTLGNNMVWTGLKQSLVAPPPCVVVTRPRTTRTTTITTVSSPRLRTMTEGGWPVMAFLLQCPRQAKRLMKKRVGSHQPEVVQYWRH